MDVTYKTIYKTIYVSIFKQTNLLMDFAFMVFAVALLGISANIRIPLWPVPITMQTLGVFMITFFFGSRKAFMTIILYILAGALGFGVFSGHASGIATLAGPTGGYIIGFIICAFVVGRMIEDGQGRTFISVVKCMVTGNIIIYSFGLVGLWLFLGNVGIGKILMLGLIPFLIGDAIKIVVAAGLFPYLWKASR